MPLFTTGRVPLRLSKYGTLQGPGAENRLDSSCPLHVQCWASGCTNLLTPSNQEPDGADDCPFSRSWRGGGDIVHARGMDYAMHDYARCISTKTQGDCKQEGSWDCNPPNTDNTDNTAKPPAVTPTQSVQKHPSISPLHISILAPISAHLLSFGSRRDTTFLIFRRWKNFIVLQSIFSSGNMCRCILVDKIVHDKHKELHWTGAKQNIMHDYANQPNCALCPRPAQGLRPHPRNGTTKFYASTRYRHNPSCHWDKLLFGPGEGGGLVSLLVT